MYQKIIPGRHSDPWVDLLRDYITETVESLVKGGLRVERSWLDPCGPRDATILYSSLTGVIMGLVWDEETGWRRGHYVSGQPGMRTELIDAGYLSGGVLLDTEEVTRRVVNGVSEQRSQYRSAEDLRDGLDDALRQKPYRLALRG